VTTVSPGLKLAEATSKTIAKRFAAKCAPKDENDCILWLGNRSNTGYGIISTDVRAAKRHMAYAHRVAWSLSNGDIPPKMVICHRCDNRLCANVDHLFLGTYKQNTRDMVLKGRHYWRRPMKHQKLNAVDVERIRDLRFMGCTQQAIADHIGVSRPLISMVLSGVVQHAR
jgi:HNH endonuclease